MKACTVCSRNAHVRFYFFRCGFSHLCSNVHIFIILPLTHVYRFTSDIHTQHSQIYLFISHIQTKSSTCTMLTHTFVEKHCGSMVFLKKKTKKNSGVGVVKVIILSEQDLLLCIYPIIINQLT